MANNNVSLKITEPNGAKYEMNYQKDNTDTQEMHPADRRGKNRGRWSSGGWAFGAGFGLGLGWSWLVDGIYYPYQFLPYPPYPYPYRYPYFSPPPGPLAAPTAPALPAQVTDVKGVTEERWQQGAWMYGKRDNKAPGWWYIVDGVYFSYPAPPPPPEKN